jgi:Ca2+-binding RTX toxin-like protein
MLRLPNGRNFAGAITTNLISDSGRVPEVANADGGSTVDWNGQVIRVVVGSTGDDTITGGDAAEMIFDGEELDTDRDTISGGGGNDLIDAQDAAADDKVECGGGHDTVYFDEEHELVFPEDCEEQFSAPNTLGGRQAAADEAKGLEEAAPSRLRVHP